jgi:hypothetical protein
MTDIITMDNNNGYIVSYATTRLECITSDRLLITTDVSTSPITTRTPWVLQNSPHARMDIQGTLRDAWIRVVRAPHYRWPAQRWPKCHDSTQSLEGSRRDRVAETETAVSTWPRSLNCDAQCDMMVERDITRGDFAWLAYLMTHIFIVHLNTWQSNTGMLPRTNQLLNHDMRRGEYHRTGIRWSKFSEPSSKSIYHHHHYHHVIIADVSSEWEG